MIFLANTSKIVIYLDCSFLVIDGSQLLKNDTSHKNNVNQRVSLIISLLYSMLLIANGIRYTKDLLNKTVPPMLKSSKGKKKTTFFFLSNCYLGLEGYRQRLSENEE